MSTEPKDQELDEIVERMVISWFHEPVIAVEDEIKALITKRETLARIDEHHKLDATMNLNMNIAEWSLHREAELKKGLDTNHE